MKHNHHSFTFLSTLLFFGVFFSGCISSPQRSGNEPEIRDVPYQARENRDGIPRKRLMVLPFLDQSARKSEKVAQVARATLVRTMSKTDDFVIISNSDFPKDLSQFVKNGEYDLEALSRIGSSMGLIAIVEGKVIEVKAKRVGDEVGLVRQIRAELEATVNIRMVACKNGHIVLNEMRNATLEDSTTRFAERSFSDRFLEEDPKLLEGVVRKAFDSSVPKIVQAIDKLSWEGRIALVKGERIFLNAGRLSGIQVGDILKVTEEGEDVYDPDSGGLIGKVPGRLKGTLEVISYFGKDGAISVVHSGSGFRENDIVEMY